MLASVVLSIGPFPGHALLPPQGSVMIALAAHVAALLVVLAGVAKLRRPGATRDALAWSRPWATTAIRALGVGEVGLAVVVLTVGGRPAFGVLALAYVGFIAVAVRQRRAGRGCGCFGTPTVTVGPLHLVVDGVAALAAGAAAVLAVPGVPGVLPTGLVPAATSMLLLVTATFLGQLLLTALPELLQVRARVASGDER